MKKAIYRSITLVCLTLGLLWELAPSIEPGSRLAEVPLEGVNFYGKELPLTEVEREAVGAASVLKRTYMFNGQGYLVTVVDGTRNRSAVHDVAYCLRGASSTVEDAGEVRLAHGAGRLLRVTQDDGSSLEILTWFSTPGRQFHSFFRYWASSSWKRLTFKKFGDEPLLVTIRAVSENNIPLDWSQASDAFCPQIGL